MSRRTKAFVLFLFITFILIITNPNDEDVYNWLSNDYNIESKDYSKDIKNPDYRHGLFEKNGTKIQDISSHLRDFGVFMSVEKEFKYENGEVFTIRGLGILSKLFPMNDNILWKWLNWYN